MSRIRINVSFGETKVLVGCGEGNLTVDELVSQAIVKFKKRMKMHEEDQVDVDSVFHSDGSYIDKDDEVCEVLDNKDTVVLEYKLIPHDAPPDFTPVLITPAVISTASTPSVAPSTSSSTSTPSLQISNPFASVNGSPTNQSQKSPVQSIFASQPSLPSVMETSMPLPAKDLDRAGSTSPRERVGNGHAHQQFHVTGDQEGLSQVIEEEPTMGFSQEHLSFQSQVSVEGSQTHPIDHHPIDHHPQVRVVPSINTESPSASEGYNRYERELSEHHTTGSVFMDNQQAGHPTHDSANLQKPDSPASILSRDSRSHFPFHESPSIEHLNFPNQPQRPGAGRGAQEMPALSQANVALAQRQFGMNHPVALSQQDLFHPSSYSNHPSHEMFSDIAASQPTDWAPPHSRGWDVPRRSQYDMWGPPHGHGGQFPPPGRGPPGDMFDGYMGFRPQSQYEHPELTRRRLMSGSDYGDYYKYGQHPGYRVNPHPHRWNKAHDDDKHNMGYPQGRMSFRGGHEEDASFDYLSQPSTLPTGRYGGYHSGIGMSGSGRLGNVPSGYSLSQSSGSMYMKQHSGRDVKRKSVLKNRNEQSPRGDLGWNKDNMSDGPIRERTFSVEDIFDEDADDLDNYKTSPFRRSTRKSMFLDSSWGLWEEKLEEMDISEFEGQVPEYNGEASQMSQRTSSPILSGDEDTSFDDVRIVELLKGDEPLGVRLVSYTSNGRDVGVFISAIDADGFAAKSGKLQVSDRILACNGEDFTAESNARVEERFRDMVDKEPLLRIAVTRDLTTALHQSPAEEQEGMVDKENERPTMQAKPSADSSSSPAAALLPNTVTNTRQIGVKHAIELKKGPRGFGFGLTSRDVSTSDNDCPVYVKAVHSDGPAFHDGRLRIGDRILEVNGVAVKSKSQSEVAALLRSSSELVKLVVSRQETVEMLENAPDASSAIPESMGKDILSFNIPLDTCGVAGLGVTVHGSKKKQSGGDMGIYIKSIVPGGAAAQDGRLQVSDQLLIINQQSLTNMSNNEALVVLKKALSEAVPGEDSSIHLTVARMSGVARKHSHSMATFSAQMPALAEETPAENERGAEKEVGIDCPPEFKSSQEEVRIDVPTHRQQEDPLSHSSESSGSLVGRHEQVGDSFSTSMASWRHQVWDSDREQSPRATQRGNEKQTDGAICRRDSSHRQSSLDGSLERRPKAGGYQERSLDRSSTRTTRDSGRVYNRSTSPHSSQRRAERSIDVGSRDVSSPLRHSTMSPTALDRQSSHYSTESLDRRGHVRNSPSPYCSASMHGEMVDYSRRSATLPYHGSEQPLASSTSMRSLISRSRESSFRRAASPPYDNLEQKPSSNERLHRRSFSQNRIEMEPSSHTLPKHHLRKKSKEDNAETVSLVSYASDPELNNPFQRDDINRKSIQKNKKQPAIDFKHMRLANLEPQIEGESSPSPPLFRTGSDGDIAGIEDHIYSRADMLEGVRVGPNLRMAKSSSLESLQTVMHYTIRADSSPSENGIRHRGTRNSFRRAVDQTFRQYSSEDLSTAVISHTKSPTKSLGKQHRKNKGILHWIRKRKGKKDKSSHGRPGSHADFEASGDDYNDLAKQFGISPDLIRRMQSHSGRLDDDVHVDRHENEKYL